MGRERGSTTIMAIIAMLVLGAASTSYVYVANRNTQTAAGYTDGLQAQYSAEAAVKVFDIAGLESVKAANGWSDPQESALANWRNKTSAITLPGAMGTAEVRVIDVSKVPGVKPLMYDVQAKATFNKTSRLAYSSGMNLDGAVPVKGYYNVATMQELIQAAVKAGQFYVNKANPGGIYDWKPSGNNDGAMLSPGFNDAQNIWKDLTSQVLFTDQLGLTNYTPTEKLQLVFRINDYVKLYEVPGSNSGCGYGIYYLAQKGTALNKPTAYVIQFDPGLNPSYSAPSDGAWGASFTGNPGNWPYGTFLVKKVNAGTEVWDESGSYQVHYGFQNNNELTQRYYDGSGTIKPNLSAANLVLLSNSATWALQPAITTAGSVRPTVTRVPTAFGYKNDGTYALEMTGAYHARPPDLRIAYTLGNIAEGNPWQPNTYYPQGAKVAVGVWDSEWAGNAIEKRMVWVATQAGTSGTSKPSVMSSTPLNGATVVDNTVLWTAQYAPTSEELANYILAHNPLSLARISMADVAFRVDSVNGTKPQSEPFTIPFIMLLNGKNKTSVELWADNKGNRIHLIRVNDVLVLAFNDKYKAGKNNIIGQNWELNPSGDPHGTGIRIWNAAAEFFTSENYGQTMAADKNTKFGIWGN